MPFAVVIAMAASAGFATPLGYQTHLMVYGAGGYRFSDYVRIGVPLDLLIMAVALVLTSYLLPVPLIKRTRTPAFSLPPGRFSPCRPVDGGKSLRVVHTVAAGAGHGFALPIEGLISRSAASMG